MKKQTIFKYLLVVPLIIVLFSLNNDEYFINNDYLNDIELDDTVDTAIFLEEDDGWANEEYFDDDFNDIWYRNDLETSSDWVSNYNSDEFYSVAEYLVDNSIVSDNFDSGSQNYVFTRFVPNGTSIITVNTYAMSDYPVENQIYTVDGHKLSFSNSNSNDFWGEVKVHNGTDYDQQMGYGANLSADFFSTSWTIFTDYSYSSDIENDIIDIPDNNSTSENDTDQEDWWEIPSESETPYIHVIDNLSDKLFLSDYIRLKMFENYYLTVEISKMAIEHTRDDNSIPANELLALRDLVFLTVAGLQDYDYSNAKIKTEISEIFDRLNPIPNTLDPNNNDEYRSQIEMMINVIRIRGYEDMASFYQRLFENIDELDLEARGLLYNELRYDYLSLRQEIFPEYFPYTADDQITFSDMHYYIGGDISQYASYIIATSLPEDEITPYIQEYVIDAYEQNLAEDLGLEVISDSPTVVALNINAIPANIQIDKIAPTASEITLAPIGVQIPNLPNELIQLVLNSTNLNTTPAQIKAEAIKIINDRDYIPSIDYLIVASGLSSTIIRGVEDDIDNSNNIDVEMVNPFFGADCSSFEYAMPAGTTKRACAVKDFGNTFYGIRVYADGSFVYNDIEISYDTIYFTMPTWMTNSQAANNTALAVTAAIRATDIFITNNPKTSKTKLGEFFESSLKTSLSVFGGSFQLTAPFNINSPAPYLTNFGGAAKIDC